MTAPGFGRSRGTHAQFLVGEFVHELDGSRWLVLVNKHFHHSSNFHLELAEPGWELEMLSPFNGQLQPLAGENNWLAPGQGMVLRVTE